MEHHLDDRRIIERGADLVAKRVLELADKPRMRTKCGHGHRSRSDALKAAQVGPIARRAHPIETRLVDWQDAGDAHGLADELHVAEARHRPARTSRIRSKRTSVAVAISSKPFVIDHSIIPANIVSVAPVQEPVSPPLDSRVDAKARTLDHGRFAP